MATLTRKKIESPANVPEDNARIENGSGAIQEKKVPERPLTPGETPGVLGSGWSEFDKRDAARVAASQARSKMSMQRSLQKNLRRAVRRDDPQAISAYMQMLGPEAGFDSPIHSAEKDSIEAQQIAEKRAREYAKTSAYADEPFSQAKSNEQAGSDQLMDRASTKLLPAKDSEKAKAAPLAQNGPSEAAGSFAVASPQESAKTDGKALEKPSDGKTKLLSDIAKSDLLIGGDKDAFDLALKRANDLGVSSNELEQHIENAKEKRKSDFVDKVNSSKLVASGDKDALDRAASEGAKLGYDRKDVLASIGFDSEGNSLDGKLSEIESKFESSLKSTGGRFSKTDINLDDLDSAKEDAHNLIKSSIADTLASGIETSRKAQIIARSEKAMKKIDDEVEKKYRLMARKMLSHELSNAESAAYLTGQKMPPSEITDEMISAKVASIKRKASESKKAIDRAIAVISGDKSIFANDN